MRVGEQFCPGILHAVPAKDGMLIRVRVPGGFIDGTQLGMIADLSESFADGQIEITSRANLQLRGIDRRNLSTLADGLGTAGMLPSAMHDRIRNITTSPFSGLDPDELVNTTSMVKELDESLVSDDFLATLHARFSFGLHSGGKVYRQEQDDLALSPCASSLDKTATLFQLFFGSQDTGYAVPEERAVPCLLQAAKLCVAQATQHSIPGRIKNLAAAPGALERVLDGIRPYLVPSPSIEVRQAAKTAPVGIRPGLTPRKKNLVPSIPLGRLTALQAKVLARVALTSGCELRLASWRGIVLGGVAIDQVADISSRLEEVHLYLDGRQGFQGIVACAGIAGCDAALADVRADAVLLAGLLAKERAVPDWTVHFSGCEKQCAMRHNATASLIGDPGGYLVRLHGKQPLKTCSSIDAIALVLDAHAASRTKVDA